MKSGLSTKVTEGVVELFVQSVLLLMNVFPLCPAFAIAVPLTVSGLYVPGQLPPDTVKSPFAE